MNARERDRWVERVVVVVGVLAIATIFYVTKKYMEVMP